MNWGAVGVGEKVWFSSEVIINDANGNQMALGITLDQSFSVLFIPNAFCNCVNTALLVGICVAASAGMDQMP